MNTMGKFISNLFLGALAIGLSIFTGSRTLDLLAWALPAGQEVYQWLGLAAFEGGMYFWSFYFVAGAKGTPQRSISIVMAVLSVVAVCVATVADLSLDASQSGKIAPLSSAMQQSLIVFLGVVIALNVAAFLACKLMSIDKLREAAEQSAEDMIHAEGLRAITAIAPHMAAQAAPHLAAEWATRTWARIVPGATVQPLALPAAQPAQAMAPTPAPAQPQPVVVPSQAPKKRGLLSFLGVGGKGQAAPASLAQTAPLPVQPAQTWDNPNAFANAVQQGVAQATQPAQVARPRPGAGPARPRRHHVKPAHRKQGGASAASFPGSQPSNNP